MKRRVVLSGALAAFVCAGAAHPVQGIETAVTLRVSDVLKGDVRPD